MSKIKIAQSTDIREFSQTEFFSSLEGLGYDGVDYLAQIRNFYKKPEYIIQLSKKHKLPIISIHQPKAFVGLHPKIFFKKMMHLLDFFPDLLLSNYHLSGFVNIIKTHPRSLHTFTQIAKEHNKIITFESNPKFFNKLYPKEVYVPEIFAEFCMRYKLPMTFDTSHIADQGYDIVTFFKKYHQHIHLIHLSDYHNGVEHLPLGMGNLPIKKLLQEIKNTSWKRLIVFEIGKFPGAKNKKQKINHLKKSLDMVRKYT